VPLGFRRHRRVARNRGRPGAVPGLRDIKEIVMTRARTLALAAALMLAAAGGLATGARADMLQGRINNQENRIEEGVDNGSLTRGEARRLRRQDARIERERHRMARNGLSQRERQILKRDLNRESDRIHDQRTDEQSR
jgi:hypothetical protein